MNFLAHIFLSGENEEIIIGNFIGDFIKGNSKNSYPDKIQKGIILHRSIDHFTDGNDIVKKSKIRLRTKYRHYAPVIVDIFYDHFLAKEWKYFSNIDLMTFTKRFYTISSKYHHIIPQNALYMLENMSKNDWLYHYQFVENMRKVFRGMNKRTPFESKMDEATDSLLEKYDDFRDDFHQFFPHLQLHVKDFLNSN